MKKSIFTLIAVLFLTLTANAQRDGSFDRVQIKKTTEGTEVDSLLAKDSKGHVKHIPQSQIINTQKFKYWNRELDPFYKTITTFGNDSGNYIKFDGGNSQGSYDNIIIGARNVYFSLNDRIHSYNDFVFENDNKIVFKNGTKTVTLKPTYPSFNPVDINFPAISGKVGVIDFNGELASPYFVGDGSKLTNVNAATFGDRDVSEFLDTSSNQYNILGFKEFANRITFNGGALISRLDLKPSTAISINSSYAGMQIDNNGYLMFNTPNDNTTNFAFNNSNLTAKRTYILPDAPGELLLKNGDGSGLTNINAATLNGKSESDFLEKSTFYEESTFSPTLVDAGGGATYSGSATASYVRIGNLVYFNLNIASITTTGTPTGKLEIHGMPFDIVDFGELFTTSVQGSNVAFSDIIARYAGATKLQINYGNGTNGVNRYNYEDVTFNYGIVSVSGSYRTNVYTP